MATDTIRESCAAIVLIDRVARAHHVEMPSRWSAALTAASSGAVDTAVVRDCAARLRWATRDRELCWQIADALRIVAGLAPEADSGRQRSGDALVLQYAVAKLANTAPVGRDLGLVLVRDGASPALAVAAAEMIIEGPHDASDGGRRASSDGRGVS